MKIIFSGRIDHLNLKKKEKRSISDESSMLHIAP
jgi:hypothetical protein